MCGTGRTLADSPSSYEKSDEYTRFFAIERTDALGLAVAGNTHTQARPVVVHGRGIPYTRRTPVAGGQFSEREANFGTGSR